MRATGFDSNQVISAGGRQLFWANTFSDVATGQAFWYKNSNGLMEIAVNQGRADELLNLNIGDNVTLFV